MTDYKKIPENILIEIGKYVKFGQPTGDFVKAILCNDLGETVSRASKDVINFIPLIVKYVFNRLPSCACGNEEFYNSWISQGGLQAYEGQLAKELCEGII